ncbi:UDP-N-acetylmuramate--L-alanine ligase [Frankia casuarinae]|uniref:UDP-N-acetylmuramate--L-alanine ligase n=2 Tax=Frankia casuarinae (strain DSM 45818 / CECT 9043 / HFP020203 / CcI3) TaxID=106370 RepID=MURC_FRACC|nr:MULTISPECIES: UDP-N-acetylmuramate--L-alanine ligase [Frankia]Q2JD48.1 RecName: Full=UDP-N-acetylmuramate--L-alanine ligase; AltName: Full=UDP-N-acetylmuramoyl-L-alanine synthetase [Frankia casuarinae]ABD10794.1 UDP-N-acetylmuramate--L-alanine ligase [Frankia casuarinae]ETA02143.1 UDP-N-acetylmuramate--L-alanine ligase [Frankia sp. CcI6]EYT90243.1 UDP-N-acetylmuramate--L-alanine ligase [Frankia casuarinae]KDA44025.1 UDP-N-acetylmuramate--L-alanine ligase [Frankia sp. BMG5.23]OHV57655.1 UDP
MTGQRTQHVHFLGIGGSGLSPLAQIHLAGGGTVSGSDSEDSPRVATLRARGVPIRIGATPGPAAFAAELAGADVVVASSALPDDHPEIVAARALGLPVRRRSEWLPELTAGYRLVAVAGSHGKSTTSAMLTLVLRAAGLDPTAVIGAEVSQLGGNALAGSGDVFVLESDEYGGAFAGLDPSIAVITNVEWEHPDVFPDEASVRTAFAAFARRVRPGGRLVVCGDHPGVVAVLTELGRQRPGNDVAVNDVAVIDYGFGAERHWRAVDVVTTAGDDMTRATVLRAGQEIGALTLTVPGRHSVLNALAVLATATELGVAPAQTLTTLTTFTGAARRFEFVGFWNGPADSTGVGPAGGPGSLEVIDDYAHHPTEVRLTLAAARSRARGRQIWTVLQPHTFSRFAALLDDFAAAFSDADRVYVTDIYAARETDDLGLHAVDLVKRVSEPAATYYVSWPELVERLATDVRVTLSDEASRGILLLTLGAGTITTVGPRLLAALGFSAAG